MFFPLTRSEKMQSLMFLSARVASLTRAERTS